MPADSAESDSLLFTGDRSPSLRSLLPSPLRPGLRPGTSVQIAQYSWSQGVVSFGWSASCLSRTATREPGCQNLALGSTRIFLL